MQNYWKKEQIASLESILSIRPWNLDNLKYLRLSCFTKKLPLRWTQKEMQLRIRTFTVVSEVFCKWFRLNRWPNIFCILVMVDFHHHFILDLVINHVVVKKLYFNILQQVLIRVIYHTSWKIPPITYTTSKSY